MLVTPMIRRYPEDKGWKRFTSILVVVAVVNAVTGNRNGPIFVVVVGGGERERRHRKPNRADFCCCCWWW